MILVLGYITGDIQEFLSERYNHKPVAEVVEYVKLISISAAWQSNDLSAKSV